MVFFEDVFEKRKPFRPKSAKRPSSNNTLNMQRRFNTANNNSNNNNNTSSNKNNNISPSPTIFSSQWISDITKLAMKEQLKSGNKAAIRILTRALGQRSFDQGIVLRGWFYLEYGNYESAKEDFLNIIQKTLNVSPVIDGDILSRAYRGYGCVSTFLNNFEEAKFAFSKSLLLDKDKYPTLLGNSILNLKYRKTLSVESNVDDMFAITPNIPHGSFIRGLAKYRWGIKHDAMKDFEECIYMCFQTSPMPCHLLALSIKYQIEVMIIEERYKEANEKAKILSNVLQKECRGKGMEDFVVFGIRLNCWKLPTEKNCLFYERMTRAMLILSSSNDEEDEDEDDVNNNNNNNKSTENVIKIKAEQSPGEFDRSILYAINLLENAKKINMENDYRVYHWQGFANILLGQWTQGFSNFQTAILKLRDDKDRGGNTVAANKLLNKILSYGLYVTRAGLATEKGRLEHAIRYLSVAEKTQKHIYHIKLKNGDACLISPLAVWRRALIKMFLVQTKSERKERQGLLRQAYEDFHIVLDRIHSHPTNVRVRGYLASAYRQAGKPKHALAELDCALYLIDEYFNVIFNSYYKNANDRGDNINKNINNEYMQTIEEMQRRKFLPLVKTLWLERAACFIALNHFESANEDLNAYDENNYENRNGSSNDNMYTNYKKSSPAHALRVRLYLEVNQRSEALKLSTKLLWNSNFEMEDPIFRLWVHHQHVICLVSKNLYGNAERHCNTVIEEMAANNTVGIEHIIDLRARLRIQNGNVESALSDFVEANRRQQRFTAVANDILALRALYPVVGNNGWLDETDLYTRSAQKLSIAIRTISVKNFSNRKKLHDHRTKQMFEPFFLHMYRGVMLTYLHEYKDAFIDFEYALTHLEQEDGDSNASPANFTHGNSNMHQHYRHQSPSSSSSYVSFYGVKAYLIVKTFVAYNGGVALTLDDQFQHAASWFNIAMNCQKQLLYHNDDLMKTYTKSERKLYENRYKIIKLFHAITNFASGNPKQGKRDIKELGGKQFMKKLESNKSKSKSFSSVPTIDLLDGCLNHAKKNKSVRKHIRKAGISFMNNKLIMVRAGAYSIKTRQIIFWPHFSKLSLRDSLPSMERFSILSYAINNVKNQDDIVTTPCNRIMSNHLDEALEHDLQVPTITAVSMDQQILVAKQKEEERQQQQQQRPRDAFSNNGSNNNNDNADYFGINSRNVKNRNDMEVGNNNDDNNGDLVIPRLTPLNETAIDNHIQELKMRKEELTRAILESEQKKASNINQNRNVGNKHEIKEEDTFFSQEEIKEEEEIIEEEQVLNVISKQEQNRTSTRRGSSRTDTNNGNLSTFSANNSNENYSSLLSDTNGTSNGPTWKSLGFEGDFKDQYEVFAGYPSFSDEDEIEEEESYYSSAEEVDLK